MRKLHPINWIQWLTLALAVCVSATTPIMYFRLSNVQHSIQAERYDAVISSCRDQNERHGATIRQLDNAGAKAIKKNPTQKAQIEASVAQFKLIFNASTPKRNCAALAAKYVSQGS